MVLTHCHMWKSQRLDHPSIFGTIEMVPKLDCTMFHAMFHAILKRDETGIFPYMASDLTLKHGSFLRRQLSS